MQQGTIQLTANFSVAPEINDPSGFALYDTNGGAYGWMNSDVATFEDGDEYTVELDKDKRVITLKNVTQNAVKTIEY